jgi:hypothetical protein
VSPDFVEKAEKKRHERYAERAAKNQAEGQCRRPWAPAQVGAAFLMGGKESQRRASGWACTNG